MVTTYMALLEELEILRKKVIFWFLLLVGATAFFMIFSINTTTVPLPYLQQTITLPLPTPSFEPLSLQLLRRVQKDLLTKEIELIIISPLDILWVQMSLSLFLGLLVTFPVILYQLLTYLTPGLHAPEKRFLLQALLPASLLFLGGVLFAYFFFVPLTLKFLYSYVLATGIHPYFEISQFISLVLILTIASGVFFLLPVLMAGLTTLGLVEISVWRNNWRYAFLFFLIFSAIITPDNTGMTMLILTFILSLLYLFGYLTSRFFSKNKARETQKEFAITKEVKTAPSH